MDNYAFDSTVSITATSSDVSFPVSNLSSKFRSRAWRSSGYFKITDSNKYIDFAEAIAGPELTATITEGEYTATTLAAAIKSALEAPGANTYTVTYDDADGYWTIASSGSDLELRGDTGTNSANTALGVIGFDTSTDYTGAATYEGAYAALHTEEAILFDLKTAEPIDSFALVFDPRIGCNLSGEAVVTLQASATNAWDTPGVSQVLTFNEEIEVYQHFFSAPQEYRYWRVKIVDPRNPDLYVSLHAVVLGYGLVLDHGAEAGFSIGFVDQSKTQENDYGYRFSDTYPPIKNIAFDLAFMPQADLENLSDAFERVGNVVPVYCSLDALDELLDPVRFSVYGYIKGDLKAKSRFMDNFDIPLVIEEAV
jgi:hypothetical protein